MDSVRLICSVAFEETHLVTLNLRNTISLAMTAGSFFPSLIGENSPLLGIPSSVTFL